MTPSELCEMSLEELDAMSMAQLEEYFKPYWPITRPERKPAEASKIVHPDSVNMIVTGSKRGKHKSTNPDELRFQNNLTPEKQAMLKQLGLM